MIRYFKTHVTLALILVNQVESKVGFIAYMVSGLSFILKSSITPLLYFFIVDLLMDNSGLYFYLSVEIIECFYKTKNLIFVFGGWSGKPSKW